MGLAQHDWWLYQPIEVWFKEALKRFGCNTPEDLARFNSKLYVRLRNRALRRHYKKMKKISGPIKLKRIRELFCEIWGLSPDGLSHALYRGKKQ